METMLRVEEVCFSYNGKLILQDVYLRVQTGEVLAVVGPNGAGKTTLIRAISGVLSPQKGLIQVAGINLARLNPTQRARYLAVVPQARELPPTFTVFQTVMFGRTPYLGWLGNASAKDEQIVQRVLRSTQLEELAERHIGELSGGEQQRVLLARALAQNTPLLLLDEPTAHLDLQHQTHLLNLVRQTADQCGLAVLLAIHDLNLVGLFADRVLLLVDGMVQCVGTPSEVLTKTNIERAYQVSVEVITHPKYGTPLIIPDNNGQVLNNGNISAAIENLSSTQGDRYAEAVFSNYRFFREKDHSPLYLDERFGVKGKRG
ncbi:MAG: heme ABC transporter ATP-binding protein [Anaerolineales bacterium]